ncbi:unnamed protein product [Absidia cylindrospora]
MVVQNVYRAGHFIGMMYRVKDDNSSLWTDEELRQDIINSARTIETLITVSPKYVRLHYTPEPDLRVESILHELGFVLIGYNLDSQDYSHKDPTGPNSIEDIYRRSFLWQKDTYDAKGSFISIQYDVPSTGALMAVPFMINVINEEGYTMVRMDGCLNDPKPYKKSMRMSFYPIFTCSLPFFSSFLCRDVGADSREYISDHFSFNTTGYHQGQKAIATGDLDSDDGESEDEGMFTKETSIGSATQLVWSVSAALIMIMLLFV